MSGVRERYLFQGGCCMLSRLVDQYGEGYPVPEGISCAGAGLL